MKLLACYPLGLKIESCRAFKPYESSMGMHGWRQINLQSNADIFLFSFKYVPLSISCSTRACYNIHIFDGLGELRGCMVWKLEWPLSWCWHRNFVSYWVQSWKAWTVIYFAQVSIFARYCLLIEMHHNAAVIRAHVVIMILVIASCYFFIKFNQLNPMQPLFLVEL